MSLSITDSVIKEAMISQEQSPKKQTPETKTILPNTPEKDDSKKVEEQVAPEETPIELIVTVSPQPEETVAVEQIPETVTVVEKTATTNYSNKKKSNLYNKKKTKLEISLENISKEKTKTAINSQSITIKKNQKLEKKKGGRVHHKSALVGDTVIRKSPRFTSKTEQKDEKTEIKDPMILGYRGGRKDSKEKVTNSMKGFTVSPKRSTNKEGK